jgi:hypothetical protein
MSQVGLPLKLMLAVIMLLVIVSHVQHSSQEYILESR